MIELKLRDCFDGALIIGSADAGTARKTVEAQRLEKNLDQLHLFGQHVRSIDARHHLFIDVEEDRLFYLLTGIGQMHHVSLHLRSVRAVRYLSESSGAVDL